MSKKSSTTLLNRVTGKNFQLIALDDLKPHENNSRKHSPEQIEKLAGSIAVYGFISPIVIDGQNRIIAGHARVLAARKAGLQDVPVIKIEHLNEAQIRSFIIADNRLAELAEWDDALLKAEFQYLVNAELNCEIDFSPTITGFETAQIDNFLEEPEPSECDAVAELVSELEDKPPVSRRGDLWLLGKHRVLCGDSLEKESYSRLMDNEKARIVCSDAPYNVPINGFVSGNGATKHREFTNASGEMSPEEFIDFLYRFLFGSLVRLIDGGLVYLFMDWRHDQELQAAARKAGLKQVNLCIWDKGSGGMGSLYRSQHELVFVYKHGSASHINNIMLGRSGRNRTNVWYHAGANRTRQGRAALKSHPTPKPVPLIMDIIKDSTKIKDIILDPFLGSGSTVLAAEKTRRRCFAIEIDPLYVDLAITRWQQLTGSEAVHAETGMTFSDSRKNLSKPGSCRVRERKHVRS